MNLQTNGQRDSFSTGPSTSSFINPSTSIVPGFKIVEAEVYVKVTANTAACNLIASCCLKSKSSILRDHPNVSSSRTVSAKK